ncbi:hypothetical protein [Streptomyces sp. t39]|uniref:hypothetical protein n=1 Tax=Streptomyces sp. t39 TaxID=1828156 RepID=UPI0011CDC048|nr:hypothetical protein [Streptomyces sp. t39]TXS50149.1 hypothetical protein EAO77_27965 [Streptomyces sp. t39]
MSLDDRRAAALAALRDRAPAPAPYQPYYPGETQPSGDMPLDPVAAADWLAERYGFDDLADERSTR